MDVSSSTTRMERKMIKYKLGALLTPALGVEVAEGVGKRSVYDMLTALR